MKNEKEIPIEETPTIISLLTQIANTLADTKKVMEDNNYLLEIILFGEDDDDYPPEVATKEDYGIDLNSSAISDTLLPDETDEGLIIRYRPKKK